ncbi:MAG: carbohydrate-binding domain-containing protein [Devosia sp.]
MRMMTSSAVALVTFLTAVGSASVAAAAPALIVVTLTGQAYQGGPEFVLKFNGVVVGRDTVAAAPDPSSGDQSGGAAGDESHLQTFQYSLPDEVFSPSGAVEIEFVNDAYDGPGRDRNLIIHDLSVNGKAVSAQDYTITKKGAEVPADLIDNQVVLYTSDRVAAVAAPAAGWPITSPENVGAPLADSALTQSAPAVAVCEGKSLAIVNYERGSADVSPTQAAELKRFIASIPRGSCSVQVTGYSSLSGAAEINKIVAEARANAVLKYLKQNGAEFSSEKASAFGETDRFGPEAVDNQRVMVVVSP